MSNRFDPKGGDGTGSVETTPAQKTSLTIYIQQETGGRRVHSTTENALRFITADQRVRIIKTTVPETNEGLALRTRRTIERNNFPDIGISEIQDAVVKRIFGQNTQAQFAQLEALSLCWRIRDLYGSNDPKQTNFTAQLDARVTGAIPGLSGNYEATRLQVFLFQLLDTMETPRIFRESLAKELGLEAIKEKDKVTVRVYQTVAGKKQEVSDTEKIGFVGDPTRNVFMQKYVVSESRVPTLRDRVPFDSSKIPVFEPDTTRELLLQKVATVKVIALAEVPALVFLLLDELTEQDRQRLTQLKKGQIPTIPGERQITDTRVMIYSLLIALNAPMPLRQHVMSIWYPGFTFETATPKTPESITELYRKPVVVNLEGNESVAFELTAQRAFIIQELRVFNPDAVAAQLPYDMRYFIPISEEYGTAEAILAYTLWSKRETISPIDLVCAGFALETYAKALASSDPQLFRLIVGTKVNATITVDSHEVTVPLTPIENYVYQWLSLTHPRIAEKYVATLYRSQSSVFAVFEKDKSFVLASAEAIKPITAPKKYRRQNFSYPYIADEYITAELFAGQRNRYEYVLNAKLPIPQIVAEIAHVDLMKKYLLDLVRNYSIPDKKGPLFVLTLHDLDVEAQTMYTRQERPIHVVPISDYMRREGGRIKVSVSFPYKGISGELANFLIDQNAYVTDYELFLLAFANAFPEDREKIEKMIRNWAARTTTIMNTPGEAVVVQYRKS